MRALTLALSLAISTMALATPKLQPPQPTTTHYDFDDDVVEGTLVVPMTDEIDARNPARHPSLIHVRETFVPELVKSAESI